MKMIAPMTVTDSNLLSSNVPETDAPVWLIGTTYILGAEVMVLSVHKVYRSARAGNSGNHPVTDDGTNWIELGATNRWRVFDKKIRNLTEQLDEITYEIIPETTVTGIGFLSLGAAYIKVEVFDSSDVLLYTRELNRYESVSIIDYYTFFTTDFSLEDVADAVFSDVLGYADNRIVITIRAENPAASVFVGQLVLGTVYTLGETLTGTSIGIRDFSIKGSDIFGNSIIVERPFADTVNFNFALDPNNARRVRNLLARQRAIPSLYFAGEETSQMGTQSYGIFQDFEIPLTSHQVCYASLKVEGLT